MTTLDQVVRAVDNKEDCIVIEGDRANDVYRIVAIVVAVGVVTLAVSAINKATDHLLES